MINSYSAGKKVYGGGRPMPTVGPVDKAGYKIRDRMNKNRRNALLRKMKAEAKGQYMNPDSLRGAK